MKIMILCGVFADENVGEVTKQATAAVEISANKMQQKIIEGFQTLDRDVTVISAPFIGAFPTAGKTVYFKGFEHEQNQYTYVNFNNIWGIRNISRTKSLKKALKSFIEDNSEEKAIIIYCTHTPFIEAAVYAKEKDPRIKLCLYAPDLPEYMNLSANRSFLYNAAKKYDIAVMTRLMEKVDIFVLLTEYMKNALPVDDKPCLISEGIIENIVKRDIAAAEFGEKYVVYTGKMYERFGVKNLIDSFKYINDSGYRLVLCGSGDCDEYAKHAAANDNRICFLGQVLPEEAVEWQNKASVLVNPRPNNEDYTKYSFPSKNIEYLLTGNPVVGYMLDGMPDIYENFIFSVVGETPEAMAAAIMVAAGMSNSEKQERYENFLQYAEKLLASNIALEIIEMLRKDW